MDAPPYSPAPQRPEPPDVPTLSPATAPLLLWLVLQLLGLLVPALRLPLAAKYPDPPELLAVAVVAAVQVGAASLLFPWLMRDWRTAAAVVAAAPPFLMLAALLAARPPARVIVPSAYVAAWLAALAVWRAALPDSVTRLWGVAVAAVFSIGGAMLWYLRLEFAVDGNSATAWFGPLIAAVEVTTANRAAAAAWAWPGGSLAAAAAVTALLSIARKVRRRREMPAA